MVGKQELTVHNASVTTMTVEVKTLTIGARQVTQGIFRQLIEEPLIAQDGTLNGAPWGHVTWHPDKCDRNPEHWHIVWQNGTELRRSTVATTPSFDPLGVRYAPAAFESEEADNCLDGAVREWLHGRREKMPLARAYRMPSGAPCSDTISWRTKYGFIANADPSEVAVTAARAKHEADAAVKRLSDAEARMNESVSPTLTSMSEDWRRSELERAKTTVETAKAELTEAEELLEAELGERSYEDLLAAYQAATQAEAERRQRHRDLRTELSQLPQLFIGG